MAVYMMFLRDKPIRDEMEMQTYRQINRANPPDPNKAVLAAYGSVEALEGEAPEGVVLLQFPTVKDAKAWYNSAGYQTALQHRKKGAEYRVIIVEGL
jgi:uncharacterized protein (DUF1330 family)